MLSARGKAIYILHQSNVSGSLNLRCSSFNARRVCPTSCRDLSPFLRVAGLTRDDTRQYIFPPSPHAHQPPKPTPKFHEMSPAAESRRLRLSDRRFCPASPRHPSPSPSSPDRQSVFAPLCGIIPQSDLIFSGVIGS